MKWKLLLSALLVLTVIAPQSTVFAACSSSSNSAQSQVLSGVGETGVNCSGDGVNNAIHAAVVVLSIIVGFAAIIMVLVAGFKYITSGGDSAKVTSAKNALIYALIGVFVAAVAQLLIHFVLFQSNNAI